MQPSAAPRQWRQLKIAEQKHQLSQPTGRLLRAHEDVIGAPLPIGVSAVAAVLQ
jgi:hypothetical protein